MDGLMYPKEGKKKQKKKPSPSILHCRDGTCYLCVLLNGDSRKHAWLHKHHVFGGRNRAKSEEHGLTVWLCVDHHETGQMAAHRNSWVMDILHQEGQKAFEETHTRAEWMREFGKNYLGE